MRIRALEGLAVTYQLQGRYREAEALLRRALSEAEHALGSQTLPVADLLSDLAVTLEFAGGLEEASALYRRALEIAENSAEVGPEGLASLYHNLGGLGAAAWRLYER